MKPGTILSVRPGAGIPQGGCRCTGNDRRHAWKVEPDMAGETDILLWGLFDEKMYVEFIGETWVPYYPVSGSVPLDRYRTLRRGKAAERDARIHALARQLNLPINVRLHCLLMRLMT